MKSRHDRKASYIDYPLGHIEEEEKEEDPYEI
jgi:hypothetical protein